MHLYTALFSKRVSNRLSSRKGKKEAGWEGGECSETSRNGRKSFIFSFLLNDGSFIVPWCSSFHSLPSQCGNTFYSPPKIWSSSLCLEFRHFHDRHSINNSNNNNFIIIIIIAVTTRPCYVPIIRWNSPLRTQLLCREKPESYGEAT